MKNLQHHPAKNDWPMVVTTLNNAYLCPKTIIEMSDESYLTESKKDMVLKPYTMEEINAIIDMAERDSAAGLGQDSEEMFRELEEELRLKKEPSNLELTSSYESEVVTMSSLAILKLQRFGTPVVSRKD